jgi:hypothetical protein
MCNLGKKDGGFEALRERERGGRREIGEVMRNTTFRGAHIAFSGLKVPRQCPLFLLVEIRLRGGVALRSENVKFYGVDFVISRGKKLSRGFTAYDRN